MSDEKGFMLLKRTIQDVLNRAVEDGLIQPRTLVIALEEDGGDKRVTFEYPIAKLLEKGKTRLEIDLNGSTPVRVRWTKRHDEPEIEPGLPCYGCGRPFDLVCDNCD